VAFCPGGCECRCRDGVLQEMAVDGADGVDNYVDQGSEHWFGYVDQNGHRHLGQMEGMIGGILSLRKDRPRS
jgi:hypothetical protein